jgi:hypothetical protein
MNATWCGGARRDGVGASRSEVVLEVVPEVEGARWRGWRGVEAQKEAAT